MTLKQPQPSSPTRRAFFGRSAAALSASPLAFAFPSDARSMTGSDTDTVRRGIDETNHRFEDGFNRDAAGAARQFYTRDARILPPGAGIVQGRDRIAEF
jgi:hypothetical protein